MVRQLDAASQQDEDDNAGATEHKNDEQVALAATSMTGSARLNPLQMHILELVFDDLRQCTEPLDSPDVDQTPAQEARTFHALSRLAVVCTPPTPTRKNVSHPAFAATTAAAGVLTTPARLSLLLSCLLLGSCRVRQLTTRLLGDLLPRTTPLAVRVPATVVAQVAGAIPVAARGTGEETTDGASGEQPGSANGSVLPAALLHMIGQLQVGVLPAHLGSLAGEMRSMLAAEGVDLFRMLLNHSAWRDAAVAAVATTLQGMEAAWPDEIVAVCKKNQGGVLSPDDAAAVSLLYVWCDWGCRRLWFFLPFSCPHAHISCCVMC